MNNTTSKYDRNKNRFFIAMTWPERRRYSQQVHRDYFAKPVRVELIRSQISTQLTYVHDPVRGHTYPACGTALKNYYRLSTHQRDLADHLSGEFDHYAKEGDRIVIRGRKAVVDKVRCKGIAHWITSEPNILVPTFLCVTYDNGVRDMVPVAVPHTITHTKAELETV
jgi:hypothetical protein